MPLRQFEAGTTNTITFNFFTDVGDRTSVADPVMNVYTPERSLYEGSITLASVAGTTGRYSKDYQLPAGVTLGNWYAIGAGITQAVTLRADVFPFDIVDFAEEPGWLSVEDFREYSVLEDDDHTRDLFFKRLIATAIKLVEARTRRSWRIRNFSEVIHVLNRDRILLRNYPVVSITGLTAALSYDGATGIPSSSSPFYYRLDRESAVMHLTDSSGVLQAYEDVTLFIEYSAGYAVIPEGIRTAALALASQLLNLSTSEGIDNLRLADLNFALSKKLFEGTIGDLLNDHIKRDF